MMEHVLLTTADLLQARCAHTTTALDEADVTRLLAQIPGWRLEEGRLCRDLPHADYYRTMAFVNALAWLSHNEDHHPELTVTYNNCRVRYHTHSVNGGRGGLSHNDFICAAKASALAQQAPQDQPLKDKAVQA